MISNLVDKVSYQGDGSTKDFSVPFDIMDNDQNEIGVYLRDETDPYNPVETLQVYGSLQNYTLTGANPPTTPFNNSVHMNVAPTANQKLFVGRIMPLTQTLSLINNGNYDFAALMHGIDRVMAIIQQLNEKVSRAPLLAKTTQKGQLNIPEPRGGYILGFNAAGTDLQLYQASVLPTLAESQVTVADNTGSQALGTFSVDGTLYRFMLLRYGILRKSSNGTIRELGKIALWYDDNSDTWNLDNPTDGGSLAGVTFSVSTTSKVGTVTMTSDSFSLGGTGYVGDIRYRVIDYFLKET